MRFLGVFVLGGEHRFVDDRPDDPEAAVSETLDAISGSKLLLAQLKWFATIRSQKPALRPLILLPPASSRLAHADPRFLSFATDDPTRRSSFCTVVGFHWRTLNRTSHLATLPGLPGRPIIIPTANNGTTTRKRRFRLEISVPSFAGALCPRGEYSRLPPLHFSAINMRARRRESARGRGSDISQEGKQKTLSGRRRVPGP